MFDSVVDVVGRLRPVVAGLDVKALDPEAAAGLVGLAVEIEQLVPRPIGPTPWWTWPAPPQAKGPAAPRPWSTSWSTTTR